MKFIKRHILLIIEAICLNDLVSSCTCLGEFTCGLLVLAVLPCHGLFCTALNLAGIVVAATQTNTVAFPQLQFRLLLLHLG
jgi:hypothetical protein